MRRDPSNSYVRKARRARRIKAAILLSLLAGIAAVAVLLGNLLRERLLRAEPILAVSVPAHADVDDAGRADRLAAPAAHTVGEGGRYCLIWPENYEEDDARRVACALAAEFYDGLSVPASADPAALAALAKAAHENGLAVSVVLGADAEPEQIAALREAGTDEVIFTDVCGGTLGAQSAALLVSLCEKLRALFPALRIGFALPPAVFADGESAIHLETLSGTADCLLLDARRAADVPALCLSLRGSIAYYPLRVLLCGSETQVAADLYALGDAGSRAVQVADS